MKFISVIFLSWLLGMGAARADDEALRSSIKPEGKVLVVYFSQSENKNTQVIARWVRDILGADWYEIEPVTPYSDGYRKVLEESKQQNENHIKPAIKPFEGNLADYQTIFIGSPIWYGTYAPPVATFLAENDLSGKVIVPFCTHGGGGEGRFYEDVAKNARGNPKMLGGFTAKGSNVVERFFGYGTADKISKNDVAGWLNKIF